MGGLEVAAFMLYLSTSFVVTIMSLFAAALVWAIVDYRVWDAKTNGFLGAAVSIADGIKFGALGMVVALAVAISAWSMGDTVDELVGWFDKWSDPNSNSSK